MLKELLNALSGSTMTSAFTNPAVNGIRNVSPQASFGNFLSTLTSSLNGRPYGANPQMPYGGVNNQAIQAYNNLGTQRYGKAQALAPGAVIISSNGSLQPAFPQAFSPGLIPPQFNGANQLQGFAGAGQYGAPAANGVPLGQYPTQFGQYGVPQGGIGKLQVLIMPIIGLFSFIKSIFQIRRFTNAFQPMQVNKYVGYHQNQDYLTNLDHEDGGFDEPEPFQSQQVNSQDNFDFSRLQDL